jgi:hypothetical protein
MQRYVLLLAVILAGCGHAGDEHGGTSSSGGSASSSGAGSSSSGATSSSSSGGSGASGGATSSSSGGGSSSSGGEAAQTCEALPPAADFAAPGPFADARMEPGVGPNRNYTLFRPGASLGRGGFRHPIAAWGNGILTTPDQYQALLTLVASHGFVVIACNDVQAEQPCLSAGLDWLVQQNVSGAMAGKLDPSREVTLGYSWGGGAAIDTANRPNVKATVSLQGMPPREANALEAMHAPLLLFTSTGDTFVTADQYVTPTYDGSRVQTFYATLGDASVGHLYPVDVDALACVASLALGSCGGAALERAPTVAWLRMLACADRGARRLFYGPDCATCQAPWTARKKSWPTPDAR